MIRSGAATPIAHKRGHGLPAIAPPMITRPIVRAFFARPVRDAPEHERSDRAHQKAGSEHSQGSEQAGRGIGGREEFSTDLNGEERIEKKS